MKHRVLIIIPSAERKRRGGEESLRWKREVSALGKLSPKNAGRLKELRKVLRKRFRFPDGKDLGGKSDGPSPLMKARLRYDGNLYRKIDASLWSKLAVSESVDVLIVSSLYGLLTPEETIRKYDLSMNRAMVRRNLSLRKWWINQGLPYLLSEHIRNNSYTMVHDFLSGSFLRISDLPLSDPLYFFGRDVRFRRHSYPGLGSGSDHHRGREVRMLLEKHLG